MAQAGAEARLLSPRDVADRLGVSKSLLRRLVRDGVLPQPTYLSPRCPRWPASAVARIVDGASDDDAGYDDPDQALERWAYERREGRAAKAR